ncbi:type II toxin-antitoxin system HicA family toxin [Lichenicola cladoniae]|uniref:Type II toxin-antitoxin system HicA family toxin n=1 Tax=Lichenicola cladoniae TaxID=1484109 RepID=A0A6M8HLB7_9PROT|nr:type II toxin-antitoxin system HicA family toxin [Acetobacteraceae bacterium]QKE89137.1 type II toxin-antitoxin system HicA family toxin [Lichenicola cladoniae]
MPATFDRALHSLLRDAGCCWVRDGRHPVYYSPISGLNFPVPVGIKSAHTANNVLKQAGLPKHF